MDSPDRGMPETFRPTVVMGFSSKSALDPTEHHRLENAIFEDLVQVNGGFSNSYSRYYDLAELSKSPQKIARILKSLPELKETIGLTRASYWFTPTVHLGECDRFMDFSSLRNLNNCESFLRSTSEGKNVTGNRADYNDFDYIQYCYLTHSDGHSYYEQSWERGYVSDSRFDSGFLRSLGSRLTYHDPEGKEVQERAKLALDQFLELKPVLIEALGESLLMQKYFRV